MSIKVVYCKTRIKNWSLQQCPTIRHVQFLTNQIKYHFIIKLYIMIGFWFWLIMITDRNHQLIANQFYFYLCRSLDTTLNRTVILYQPIIYKLKLVL